MTIGYGATQFSSSGLTFLPRLHVVYRATTVDTTVCLCTFLGVQGHKI